MLEVVDGIPTAREDKYIIKNKGKGLFIVINNSEFDYDLLVENSIGKEAPRFKDSLKLKKTEDSVIDQIKKTFKLEDGDDNLIIQTLERESQEPTPKAKGQKAPLFPSLIKTVSDKMYGNKPSFLMFIMMSAGLDYGEFLLHGSRECSSRGSFRPRDAPPHSLEWDCNRRRISDLVREFQQAEDEEGNGLFADVSKIFCIQTIAGMLPRGTSKSIKEAKEVVPGDFIPRGSDTFVFYAHTEQDVGWINEHGFYLITKLCDAVDELKTNVTYCNTMLQRLENLWNGKPGSEQIVGAEPMELDPVGLDTTNGVKAETGNEAMNGTGLEGKGAGDSAENELPSKRAKPDSAAAGGDTDSAVVEPTPKELVEIDTTLLKSVNKFIKDELEIDFQLDSDSVADVWFDNLCMTVTGKITEYLNEKVKGIPAARYGLRAHISSTLRKKLSMMDILRSQWQP